MKKENDNYTATISVKQSPDEVFDAVNNVRGWWSQEIDGRTDALGEVFRFHYKDLHYTTHKITEFVPGKKVVWHITESRITFVKDKAEWKGTDVVFDITRKGDKTELRFTHVGLVPAVECYGQCAGAWGFYINESLRDLITKGQGQPNPKEQVAY
jgi:hypothetical protein